MVRSKIPTSAWLYLALLLTAFVNSCSPVEDKTAEQAMDEFIADLMQRMTIEEKIGQLNLLPGYEQIVTGEATASEIGRKIVEGRVGAIFNVRSVDKIHEMQRVAVEESRLGIPLMFGLDVIHGFQTVFPIPLALAASFDMELIRQSARIAAVEASATGICWTFSPMLDLTRDPRWGRIAEGPGEDAYLASRIAEAFVWGYQGDNLSSNNTLLSCAKHFALYGAAEAGRDYNTVDMSRISMYNYYFPPFLAAIKAGAGSIMTAFNEVDGIPASGNSWLMNEVLREEWGFDGFVVSDYTAINEMVDHGMGDLQTVSALALNAGVDMDMVGEGFLTTLGQSLSDGVIREQTIDAACRRIIEAKYKLGLFDDPYRYGHAHRVETEIFTEAHNQFARELASQTFVLLKNESQLLPLERMGKIALIGPLADNQLHMAGTWSVAADHSQSVTVLSGFVEAVGELAEIHHAKGSNIVDDPDLDRWVAVRGKPSIDETRTPKQLREEAVAIARQSDVIVAVMGEAAEMSGESASRTDLSLPGSQQELLKALLETGKPVVLVLFTGRPLTITWEHENIPAILNVWFGGTQAGHAIADVIFGDVNPSGKLPSTFPQHIGQIPIYYNHKNTGRPLPEGQWFRKFRSNYLDVTNEPLYPFGYGLSFTEFSYGDLELSHTKLKGDETLEAMIELTNTGAYPGAEVVQLYIRDLVGSITRPVKELKGFQKVFLEVGESKIVNFSISTNDLKFYNYKLEYDWEPGEFVIMLGGNSRDVKEALVEWVR
jgi:beta-glucosidase